MKHYDYLVVGAGLFGSVFSHEAVSRGRSCLVIDKRDHIAGNIFTKNVDGINVHVYGAHIFHTSDKRIWEYVNRFAEFNNYVNSPIAAYHDETYNLPFNMNTFSRMWNIRTPEEAEKIIESQRNEYIAGMKKERGLSDDEEFVPANLEEQAISLAGRDIYEKLIKEYTEKQWGRPCTELPAFIIKRLPFRFIYDNNYFNDRYQGIPVGGYTGIVEKLLEGADVRTGENYFDVMNSAGTCHEGVLSDGERFTFSKLLFTGQIDEFYGYKFGPLQYRSVRFETEKLDTDNFQGNAVVNYTSKDVPWTRIIEHKHFEFGKQPVTIISREYSSEWEPGAEPYYPVNDEKNNALYEKYRNLSESDKDVMFGGRLGLYKYYDMDKDIMAALDLAAKELA